MKVQVQYRYCLKGHQGGTGTTRTVEVAFPSNDALKEALYRYHNPLTYDIIILASKVVG